MPGHNLTATQRLRIIRWHASVCPDGGEKRSAAWKSRLAELVKVSPSTITNLCDPARAARVQRRQSATLSKLAKPSDEEFAGALGFKNAMQPVSEASGREQWTPDQLQKVETQEQYADVCLSSGIALQEEAEAGARARQADKKSSHHKRSRAIWRTTDRACWRQPAVAQQNSPFQVVPMHESEERAVAELFSVLSSGREDAATTVLHARPYSGIAHALQRYLPQQQAFASYFSGGIYHLHLDAVGSTQNFRKALIDVVFAGSEGDQLLTSESLLPKNLAEHLYAQNRLLIIHGATTVRDRNLINQLSEELGRVNRKQPNRRVSRLLLTCWDRDSFSHLDNGRPRTFEYEPEIGGDTMGYFEKALVYYLALRNRLTPSDAPSTMRPDSSLLKRIEHHYLMRSDPFTNVPSAVRFRAFCASDIGSPSPFDPTQGVWHRVDEQLRDQIPEIAGCLGDVQSDVRAYFPENGAKILSTLRLVSTGLFFFTEAMLARLKDNQHATKYVTEASLELEMPRRNYIRLKYGDLKSDGQGHVATMPLLVRSLLQDDWARWAPESHVVVHQGIAEVLGAMAEADSPGALEKELPYAPPRGRERVALALECIRHYARAAHTAAAYLEQEDRATSLTRRALQAYDRWLEAGVFRPSGNGDPLSEVGTSELSRTHGLHGLKFEVLCLLSEDGRGKRAPRGSSDTESASFFRELGIALTRMLRPTEALEAFRSALSTPSISVSERMYVNAHAVTAGLALGDLRLAETYLAAARADEADGTLTVGARDVARRRNDARAAVVALAGSNVEAAIAILDGLASGGLIPFWGDRAVAYLDAHMAGSTWKQSASALWRIAEQAAHKARNDGFEHERLRVEVRRAAIVRRLDHPVVAEAILDQIGLDLGRHGGDELVFREFQLESAETLGALSRPRYAFAAYAWPAYAWLRQGQATPLVKKTRQLCHDLLEQMTACLDEALPDLKEHPYWRVSESVDLSLAHPFFSVDLLPNSEAVAALFVELSTDAAREQYRTKLAATEQA